MRRAPVLGFSFALAVLSAAFVLLAEPVAPAGAAFPGRNGKIAYARASAASIGKTDAWTMRADGSHKRRIARNASEPAFSPSGRKIVFTRRRWNTNCHCFKGDLYKMRANGSHERSLIHTPASEIDPSFFPGGKRVVFARHGTHSGIYTIRVDGSHLRKLTTGFAFDPAVSPNGRRIVFDRRCVLRIMRADGSHEHALTPPVNETCDKVPDFSPNGRRIAFARDGTGAVYLIDTDGTDLTPLFAPAYYPAFSPNGRRIAFYRSHPDGASDIYTVRTDGSNVKRLTFSESGVRAIEPSWGVRP